jgi:hypothetical protein
MRLLKLMILPLIIASLITGELNSDFFCWCMIDDHMRRIILWRLVITVKVLCRYCQTIMEI